MRRAIAFTVALVAAQLGAADAGAQYFGQNKVRFEDLEFQVLRTQHFDVYFYEEERRAVDQAAQLAERWYTRLATLLRHELSGRQPIILYANHPDFRQTTVIGGFIDPATGGVTEGLQRRIVMPFTGSLQETNHVLGHELVHAFQYDMAGQRLAALPLWFVEGMAEYLSLGPVSAQTAAWLRDALIHEDLPAFEELDNPRYFPYRFGHGAWAYVAGRYGTDAVRRVFERAAASGDPLEAIAAVAGMPIEQLSRAWHRAVAETYSELELGGDPRGRALVTQETGGGRLNVGPALSPDGTRLVFLSEKAMFSIEMFLADATTGEVIQQLSEFATDPHLDSIEFLDSTGAWSSDGRLFAFAAEDESDPVLVVIDASSGDRVRSVELPELGEIFNPAWSPDNGSIAFSGMAGATSDLYVYDLETERVRRLTDDLYTQIQPAWSPDGRTIAFVTDQFTTDLASLDFGEYRIAAYDVATGRIGQLPGFQRGRHISPQWGPDGDLYFIAAPNGIPNVFRAALPGGPIRALTSVSTAVSGITDASPALTVASAAGDLAYTVYIDGTYAIYALDAAEAAAAVPVADVNAAVLPPARPAAARLAEILREPPAGLAPVRTFMVDPYTPNLSLQYIGAAAMTNLRADELGTFVGGGISVLFGDTLNYHQLGTTVQTGAGAGDLAAQVAYINRASRWNWGAAVQRIPYRTGTLRRGLAQVGGRTAVVEQTEIFRQVSYEASGLAEYPFSREARVEFSAGLRHIGFDRELRTDVFSVTTGLQIDEATQELAAPESLNLGRASAAYVYDSALVGGTSPVLGTRSRLEVAPMAGDLQFTEVLLDYRRYVAPVRPVTFAGRVLHVGRYGADGESGRLAPLFVGYPTMVRGYDVGSFDPIECVADGEADCPQFDQLLGSRILVGNLEMRMPIPGVFQGEFDYGPIPLEAFLFADGGVAWTSEDEPSFLDGTRGVVTSVGAGARINVFGYVIAEVNAVRPLDRPDDGWTFVFNMRPGF